MRKVAASRLIAGFVSAAVLGSVTAAVAQSAPSSQLAEGPTNTSVGQGALASNPTGINNTAVGVQALRANADGYANTAVGHQALNPNVDGASNTAVGSSALTHNVSGSANTAVGASALWGTGAGSHNVAVGYAALYSSGGQQNTVVGSTALSGSYGSSNTAVGFGAGAAVSNGWYNVYLGTVPGEQGDSQTMRLGMPDNGSGGGQTRTFIAGIAGTVLTGPAVQVFVDANGQLGTLVPGAITGTVSAPLNTQPFSSEARLAALEAMLRAQATTIAELQASLAAHRARLQTLERARRR